MSSFKSKLGKTKRVIFSAITVTIFKIFYPFKSFNFNRKKYRYVYKQYNHTWRNERCVEIALALPLLNSSTLEVGNVLSHYSNIPHTTIDKFEEGEGVIQEDITVFKSNKKFDCIISISTLEHVGFGDDGQYAEEYNPEKLLFAIQNIRSLLSDGGIALITVPLGYNPFLDKYINSSALPLSELYFMKKVGKYSWVQVSYKEIIRIKYNKPFRFANAIMIGVLRN